MKREASVDKSSMWVMDNKYFMCLIRDKETNCGLFPIFLHPFEYERMCIILNNTPTPRPLSYELFKNTLVDWGIMISKVVITKLYNETYFAEIYLSKDGEEKIMDSRPSDAIGMALLYGSPIYIEESLLVRMLDDENTRQILDKIQQLELQEGQIHE